MATDIIVSEMTSATQINTNDLMIMTQPDLQAETGYSTKKGTVLQVANKMLKGTEYLTDLPDFTDKTVLGGLEELKGDLTALLPVDTASGAIANFDTDLSLPLVDCKASIVASQTSGTPTPSSPLPITGYTEANIIRCGVNLFDNDNANVVDGYISATAFADGNTKAKTVYIPIAPNTTYTVSKTVGARFTVAVSNVIPTNGATFTTRQYDNTATSITITASATDRYLWAWVFLEDTDTGTLADMLSSVQIEVGSQATPYHAYNGSTVTIAFGQTVYGGVLDVTNGTLTVDCMKATFDLSQYTPTTDNGYDSYLLTLTHPATDSAGSSDKKLCNVCDRYSWSSSTVGYEHFYIGGANAVIYLDENTYRSGTVEFSYPLATPVTLTLTSEQIRALLGVNNVFNDTNGDTEVKYKEGIQHYIDKKIAATQALIL